MISTIYLRTGPINVRLSSIEQAVLKYIVWEYIQDFAKYKLFGFRFKSDGVFVICEDELPYGLSQHILNLSYKMHRLINGGLPNNIVFNWPSDTAEIKYIDYYGSKGLLSQIMA